MKNGKTLHEKAYPTVQLCKKCRQAWKTETDLQSSNGILLPKLFSPTERKDHSSDRERLLKFEAEGRESAKFLRSLERFIQTVKGQNNFW